MSLFVIRRNFYASVAQGLLGLVTAKRYANMHRIAVNIGIFVLLGLRKDTQPQKASYSSSSSKKDVSGHRPPDLELKPLVPFGEHQSTETTPAPWPPAASKLAVRVDEQICHVLQDHPRELQMIKETLALDTRPAYHGDDREYRTKFRVGEVVWKVVDGEVCLTKITPY